MSNYPEVNLWRAVILKTITDLEELLSTAALHQSTLGKVLRRVKLDIDTIENDIRSDGFKHICEMSGIHHHWIHKLVEGKKKEYNWESFRFQGGICTRKR